MEILVTGLHRSGTSAVANLLALATHKSLLDDPEWAFADDEMALAYKREPKYKQELNAHSIVKCPRMAEILDVVLGEFRGLKVIFVFRDPKDVYCSILEKLSTGNPTRMLDNARFGYYSEQWEGVALAFNYYAQKALTVSEKYAACQVVFVRYETFFYSRVSTIQRLCTILNLQWSRRYVPKIDKQFGPLRNKPTNDRSIKGPGRHLMELSNEISAKIDSMTWDHYKALCEHSHSLDVLFPTNLFAAQPCIHPTRLRRR